MIPLTWWRRKKQPPKLLGYLILSTRSAILIYAPIPILPTVISFWNHYGITYESPRRQWRQIVWLATVAQTKRRRPHHKSIIVPPSPPSQINEVTTITVTSIQNTALSEEGTRNKYWYSVYLWATWHDRVCGGLTYATDWRVTILLGVRELLLGFWQCHSVTCRKEEHDEPHSKAWRSI